MKNLLISAIAVLLASGMAFAAPDVTVNPGFIAGNLSVGGDAEIDGSLTVGGTVAIGGVVTDTLGVSGNVEVSGYGDFGGTVSVGDSLTVTHGVTAGFFIGDGSLLTGIATGDSNGGNVDLNRVKGDTITATEVSNSYVPFGSEGLDTDGANSLYALVGDAGIDTSEADVRYVSYSEEGMDTSYLTANYSTNQDIQDSLANKVDYGSEGIDTAGVQGFGYLSDTLGCVSPDEISGFLSDTLGCVSPDELAAKLDIGDEGIDTVGVQSLGYLSDTLGCVSPDELAAKVSLGDEGMDTSYLTNNYTENSVLQDSFAATSGDVASDSIVFIEYTNWVAFDTTTGGTYVGGDSWTVSSDTLEVIQVWFSSDTGVFKGVWRLNEGSPIDVVEDESYHFLSIIDDIAIDQVKAVFRRK